MSRKLCILHNGHCYSVLDNVRKYPEQTLACHRSVHGRLQAPSVREHRLRASATLSKSGEAPRFDVVYEVDGGEQSSQEGCWP